MRFKNGFSFLCLSIFVALSWGSVATDPWHHADSILEQAVEYHAFPGCVALVGRINNVTHEPEIIYQKAFGKYTFGKPAPLMPHLPPPDTSIYTIFDMASCTKVLATTTAAAQLYQKGEFGLHTPIFHILGSRFVKEHQRKAQITVEHCLTHTAGYPPDPSPLYSARSFGCPETLSGHIHPELSFSCRYKIHDSFMHQHLDAQPGARTKYSDLSMITMSYVIGLIARTKNYVGYDDLLPSCAHSVDVDADRLRSRESQPIDLCYYEAYVRKHVVDPVMDGPEVGDMGAWQGMGFRPPRAVWSHCAPTENDTHYRHMVVQGRVHDENTYASGGIQGHAGLFATAPAVSRLLARLMRAGEHDAYLNATTLRQWTRCAHPSRSSRALGWDTEHDGGYFHNHPCGTFSPATYMHTGFTGTVVCNDPERRVWTVLLTNRVYPTRKTHKYIRVRSKWNAAVQQIVDTL